MKIIGRFVFTLLSFLPLCLSAQQKGVVKGRVVDSKNNEPVPFAKMCIRDSITDIPEEDESLDEWFDIEAYGIKCSLESLYRDLQNYGVVDSVLKNDTIKEYYLKTIKSLIYFIRDNTDKPNRIRNHISSTLKELDDISTLGLLLQILLLQGLIKWFADVDLKERCV